MYLIFVAAEAVPFAKKGGVADIVGCLPKELEYAGHRVQIILPLHQKIDRQSLQPQKITLSVSLGGTEHSFSLMKGILPDSEVPIYFIENPYYFDREEIYGFYADNDERYAFFSLAVLETLRALELPCQVLHLHDWPTALLPLYLERKYRHFSQFRNVSTLLTIHNLIYQGLFPKERLAQLDIPEESFHWQEIEFYGQINFLKTGLIFADRISTVSPTHAKDIQSKLYGNKLEGVFQKRKEDLVGIVNGVDYSIWNPTSDPYIPCNYTDTDLSGKKFCKRYLQNKLGLETTGRPILGMISRLDRFKGLDLLLEVLPRFLKKKQVQFVLLGQGEESFIQGLQELRDMFPNQFAVHFSYNNELAHLLEAGADMYVMPSFSEPCGLNQLYSMKYGTLPIVRRVGGLADTVVDYSTQTLADGTATGFSFIEYTSEAFSAAIERALRVYENPTIWTQLQYLAMQQDWSWSKRVREYVDLYHLTLPKDYRKRGATV